MDYRDKEYEKKFNDGKSGRTKPTKEPKMKRHIVRKLVIGGISGLALLGATEELTRVGVGFNWDFAKAYGMKQKAAEEKTYAGTAVKVGDKYFKIDNGKLTGQQLYFNNAEITEDGTTVSVFVPGKGFVTWTIIPTVEIVQKLDGRYEINGTSFNTDDIIMDNTMIDFGENGGQQFVKLLTHVTVDNGEPVYYRGTENGVDRVVLNKDAIYLLDGKFYYEPTQGADLIEIVEVDANDAVVDFNNSVLKGIAKEFGAEQNPTDPAPETPTDPAPETPDEKEENPGEANSVEGQDKGTFTDKDAAKIIDAELDIMIRMEMPELININMQSMDISNGYVLFKGLNNNTKEECFYTVNLRKTGKEEQLKELNNVITKAKLGQHTENKEDLERKLRALLQEVVGNNIKEARQLETPNVPGTTLILQNNWKVDFENNSASLVDVLVTVLLNDGRELIFQMEMPEDQYNNLGGILDQEISKVLKGQTSELISSDNCDYFKVLNEKELNKEQFSSSSVLEEESELDQ